MNDKLCGKFRSAKLQREVADPMAAASGEAPVAEVHDGPVTWINPRWLSRPI